MPGFKKARWGMTHSPVDWADRNHPVVQAGLALKCGHCQAPVGADCTNKCIDGKPLPNRVIHHFRLDKAMTTDKEPT